MPSIKYSLNTNLGQSSAESCWYAAYCMLFDWKGKPTSSIRERMEAAKLDYKDYWNHGLPAEAYVRTRMSLGLSGFRRSYFASIPNDLDYFGKTLKDYGPFWCAFSGPQDGDHAVVVNGVNLDMKQILVMNPWGSGGSAEQEYYTVSKFQGRLSKRGDQDSSAQMFFE
jgi:hypothetical protein